MKFIDVCFCIMLGLLICERSFAQDQSQQMQQETMDYNLIAEQQANGLEVEFGLDYAQTFKVDTLYQHILPEFYNEVNDLTMRGFTNSDIYQNVSDKWNDYVDKVLEQIFTPEQWKKYMKSQYGKEKARRDKRMEKFKAKMGTE